MLSEKPVLKLGARHAFCGTIETDAPCFGWSGVLMTGDLKYISAEGFRLAES